MKIIGYLQLPPQFNLSLLPFTLTSTVFLMEEDDGR